MLARVRSAYVADAVQLIIFSALAFRSRHTRRRISVSSPAGQLGHVSPKVQRSTACDRRATKAYQRSADLLGRRASFSRQPSRVLECGHCRNVHTVHRPLPTIDAPIGGVLQQKRLNREILLKVSSRIFACNRARKSILGCYPSPRQVPGYERG